ncbi:MAG: PTS sugar transporter subunit IIA [Burkholderiales bacterium]|jgi:PTS system mannose-specific IIA component
MIGILLITHGSLGESLIQCANHVLGGETENIAQMGINGSDSLEAAGQKAERIIEEIDTGSGVIVLTDMFGGSPSNITQKLLSKNVIGISGINLPMLIRVLNYRGLELEQAVEKAVSGGVDGVMRIPN